MPAYAGVTFGVRGDGAGFGPEWEEEEQVNITHIPGSSADDVQFGNVGNAKMTVRAIVDNVTDLGTLKSARGITLRTLTWHEAGVTNVMLLKVSSVQTHENSGKVLCNLDFMKGTA